MSTTIPWTGPARSGLACCLLLAFAALEGCGSGGGGSAPVNLPPVASTSCAYASAVNQPLNGTLSAADPEGQSLTYSIVAMPSKGSAMVTNPLTGEFVYTPNNNTRGTDEFTFQACEPVPSTVCSNIATYKVVHTPRIMPLGDSITVGAVTSTTPDADHSVGYREPLKVALTTAGYVTDFVGTLSNGVLVFSDTDHDGHGGCTADDLLNETGLCAGQGPLSNWLNLAKPDVVLLHIGTNDISTAMGYDSNDVNDVAAILDTIQTWEDANWPVTIVLSKIITNKSYPAATTTFNTAVISMAEARITGISDKLEWVDHQANVSTDTDYGDMLHPNDLGYAKMRDVWLWPLTGTLGTVSGNHSGPGILPKCP